jgi:hypothetical protein
LDRIGRLVGGVLIIAGGFVAVGVGIGIGLVATTVSVAEVVSVAGIPLVFVTGGALYGYAAIAIAAGVGIAVGGASVVGNAFC